MIGLEDRQALARDIDVAHAAGARLNSACGALNAANVRPSA